MAVEAEHLQDVDLFRAADEEALIDMAQHCTRIELLAGATLFEQNAPGDALYVLEDGQIHILRQYEDGEQVILATEIPFYPIGNLSMLAAQPRTGTVVAVSDCTLIVLKRSTWLALCDRHHSLLRAVQERLALRLYRMNLLVRENAIGDAAARVASLLLLMAEDMPDSPLLQPYRVNRMARATATDVDVIEHLLADWESEALIRIHDDQVEILDVKRLERLAGQPA